MGPGPEGLEQQLGVAARLQGGDRAHGDGEGEQRFDGQCAHGPVIGWVEQGADARRDTDVAEGHRGSLLGRGEGGDGKRFGDDRSAGAFGGVVMRF
jgi:hypothetical protein